MRKTSFEEDVPIAFDWSFRVGAQAFAGASCWQDYLDATPNGGK